MKNGRVSSIDCLLAHARNLPLLPIEWGTLDLEGSSIVEDVCGYDSLSFLSCIVVLCGAQMT